MTWADTLDKAISETKNSQQQQKPTGIWAVLKSRVNPTEYCPAPSPDVIFQKLDSRTGSYYVLKNDHKKTYLRLSPEQFRLWEKMNGETSVQDLIVEHFMATGDFAHNMVGRLVENLRTQQMLQEPGLFVWHQIRGKIEAQGFLNKLSAPARFFLTQKLAINGIDGFITALYKTVGWVFFTKPMQVVYLILTFGGMFAFWRVIQNTDIQFIGSNYVSGMIYLWLAAILPVFIHELGHALTVKHYGREVPRGGLMLYIGLPAAFVETTDIWMEPRRARLAVTFNGPYTGLIIGGGLSIFLYFFPGFQWNSFFFKMIGVAYFTVLMNANPLLKFDGYYLLSDGLEINLLRERSLAFIRKQFIQRIRDRKKLTREERIQAVYGLLSLVWTVYALYLVNVIWTTRMRESFRVLFGDGYSIFSRILSFVMIAGIASFFILIALALVRMVYELVMKYIRSGGLTKHSRLAAHLGILAILLGVGASLVSNGWGHLLSGLLAAVSGGLIAIFSQPYHGSHRGFALQLIAGALLFMAGHELLLVFGVLTDLIPYLKWSAISLIALAGLLLVLRQLGHLKPLVLALGVGLGLTGLIVLRITGFSTPVQISTGVILILGVWNAFSLLGGARAPASILLTIGSVMYILALETSTPIVNLQLIAVLVFAAGALHWRYARLPHLTTDIASNYSARTQQAVGLAVSALIRRVVSQVFFETGWQGVNQMSESFSKAMHADGLNLHIEGNQFKDEEFSKRTILELTDIYSTAFDAIHQILCRDLGTAMGSLAFNYGIDRLPWQNREVIVELILSRCAWSQGVSKQHEADRDRLIDFLKRVPLFVMLSDEDLEKISRALHTEHFATGEIFIRQGEPGDKFYILERGHVSVWQRDESGEENKVDEKGPGQFFGEVALVTDAPRNASIHAETPVTVLTLSADEFKRMLDEHFSLKHNLNSQVKGSWLLRSMPIFDELESHEIDWMYIQMEHETIEKDAILFREGDPGDRFYIVESGELIVAHHVNEELAEIARIKSGEYFGEISLLQQRPRTATIYAAEDSVVLSLDGDEFLDMVSSYQSLGQDMDKTGTRRLSYLEN